MRFGPPALVLIALVVAGCAGSTGAPPITVGSHVDAESQLVAHLYAAALRTYGSEVRVQAAPDPLTEMDAGAIQVMPGFTGRLLERLQPTATARSDAQVYRELLSALPEGIAAGDYTAAAEDKPAVTVTEPTADAWGGRDVTAMVRNCAEVSAGASAGERRPEAVGTCKISRTREFGNDATLFAALGEGQVNAAWTTTAEPDVPSEAVVLADRTSLIRAENLVPLYRRNELSERQVLALNEIAGVLDTAALTQMRRQVADGAEPAAIADAFLTEHPLGTSH
jgi:glycine betaine/choline ABC-type transport system substrate-binding protein